LLHDKGGLLREGGFVRNDSWITGENARNAFALRNNNLAHANEVAGPVSFRGDTLYLRFGKRVFDIVFASAGIVVSLPINAIIAAITYFDVGRPILFCQERAGKDLKPFKLWKFRNMTEQYDEQGEMLPPEERITGWGLFVRRYSLDELLNFWSILKGDMSLIGPRPLPVEFTERMTERHKKRYLVRPGLENPFMSADIANRWRYAHARFENDIEYVENVSFLTDVKQTFRLVRMVFGEGRISASTGTESHFAGYDHEGIALCNGDLEVREVFETEVMGIGNPNVEGDRDKG